MADTRQVAVERKSASVRKRSGARAAGLAVVGFVAINVVLIAIAGRHLPLHSSELADPPTAQKVLGTDLMYVEVAALMVVVHLMTRRRVVPDLAARAPDRATTRREVAGMLGYGVVAMAGGYVLGRACGWHAFSFHLDGMVIRTGQAVTVSETLCWAAYNLIAFALIPLVFFRRRYSPEQLSLRSSNRRADVVLIVVVLAIESTVQLAAAGSSSILGLSPRQALLGAPLTLVLGLAGTALPTMIFIYAILTPRYLRLTGSVPATVVLGGLTYAVLHRFDGWTDFASPSDALISVLYVVLFYAGPGMFKTFITIRSANAWTHLWAYHAIAPHTLLDTPMFVKVFGIR